MTVDEIIEYMLSSVPNEYDTSVGSFFYDLLYPVAEQIYRLQGDITLLEQNAFALTAVGEYLDRKVAEQGITRKQATFSKGTVRISGDAIKKSYISYAKIGGCILAVDGVDDYANLKVNGTTANISIPPGSVPVLGSVVIT